VLNKPGVRALLLGIPLSVLAWAWSGPAAADRTVDSIEPVVISDDIMKQTTQVESATDSAPNADGGSGGGGEQEAGSSGGSDPGASGGGGSESSGGDEGSDDGGKTNHGHGNNEDGVDSSNPGQGVGGPNGAEDPSCSGDGPCVDDESHGGGAAPSKDK
jgi:hypothetical protein